VAWDALTTSDRPPAVIVETDRITPFEDGFSLEVRIRNVSRVAAAQVEIEGELTRSGNTVETARTVIAYVPGESVRRAGLFFKNDPRNHELRVRALGYADP
jgi:uncharacterized protein (TIGR02588 family)